MESKFLKTVGQDGWFIYFRHTLLQNRSLTNSGIWFTDEFLRIAKNQYTGYFPGQQGNVAGGHGIQFKEVVEIQRETL